MLIFVENMLPLPPQDQKDYLRGIVRQVRVGQLAAGDTVNPADMLGDAVFK